MNADTRTENFRIHGWVLAVASPLSMIALANHPVSSGPDLLVNLELLRGGLGLFNAAVHSFLIAMMVVLLFGFIGFSRRLGFDRPLVQAGFVAQAVGTIAALCAGIVDGFAYRRIAFIYSDATAADVDLIRGLYNLSATFTYTWGRVWLIALSAAMLLWSIQLVRQGGAARIIGGYGIAAGAIAIIGSLTGMLSLSVLAVASVFGAIALWGTAVGILLIRNRI